MKLFSPSEIKSSKETELSRDILRTKSIKEALDKVRTELNEANAQFDATLAKQRAIWTKEEAEKTRLITMMTEEIVELKKEKAKLIIPIDLERQKADNMVIEANKLLTFAKQKQKDNEHFSEILQDKLDEVSEKEQELLLREQRLSVKESGIKTQEESIKQMSANLSVQMQTFIEEISAKEKEFTERKIILDLQETNNNHILDTIKEDRKQIIRDKQLISSQRQAIKAAQQNYGK